MAGLAKRQHGVVSLAQLRSLGLNRSRVTRWLADGRLHLIHRGVYAVGHTNLTINGHYIAAVLACGPGALLSHRSAGALRDLRRWSGVIEVTVPSRRVGPRGVRIHRSRCLAQEDRTIVDGIPITSVARTLLDLAAVLPERDLNRALDRAERLRLFDLTASHGLLARAAGHHGAGPLRRAIAAWEPSYTQSEFEEHFKELVLASDLPRPLFNAQVQGRTTSWEVDAYWPQARLAVDLDSYDFHRTRQDFERDAAKNADLELAGEQVMRLSWNQAIVNFDRTVLRIEPRL